MHDVARRLDLSAWEFQLVDDVAPADDAPNAAPDNAAFDNEDDNNASVSKAQEEGGGQ